MRSADALREAWNEDARLASVERMMTIGDRGLVLGAGTVLAKRQPDHDGNDALAIDGAEERILALLAVAYGRPVPAGVIGNIRRAARDWDGGETCLALIHLAHTGLPALADRESARFRLFLAERLLDDGVDPRELLEYCDIDATALDLVKAGFDPDQPRVSAGSGRDSGEWTDGGDGGVVPAAAGQPMQNNPPADKDPFFDTLYGPVHDLARRLGIDETWLLGLAAHEGGWLQQPHNREINNPFGVTHGGGRDVQYDSIEDAVDAWGRRYGAIVQGATSARDFIQRLLDARYNTVSGDWASGVMGGIRAVQRRLDSWKSRHGL